MATVTIDDINGAIAERKPWLADARACAGRARQKIADAQRAMEAATAALYEAEDDIGRLEGEIIDSVRERATLMGTDPDEAEYGQRDIWEAE